MRYPKEVILKDGSEALIRPLTGDDVNILTEFYRTLPEEDRWYMKYDVLDPAVIQKWIESVDSGRVFSIIALTDEGMGCHAGLFMREFGATQHVYALHTGPTKEFQPCVQIHQ